MIKVGVTGGIGSGKSTVCKFFENIGIAVYYSDSSARWLMQNDNSLIEALVDSFGKDCYTESGELNKVFLSEKVFSNFEMLKKLNSIVHPAVLRDFNLWSESQTSRYVIIESAILLDIGWQIHLDKVVSVVCDIDIRINRVVNRDKVARDEVERRISSQIPDELRAELSDFLIVCNDIELVIPQVLEIDNVIDLGR